MSRQATLKVRQSEEFEEKEGKEINRKTGKKKTRL